MAEKKYCSGLISQSFWFVEIKKIIKLVLEGKNQKEIKSSCVEFNLFGVSNTDRAKRMYGCLWNRVKQLDDDLLNLFNKSDVSTQKLINLIAVIKNDKLFFEFLFEVYREKILLGQTELSNSDLNVFFKNKEIQSKDISEWRDVTKKRLGSLYFNFMADANLILQEGHNRKITPPIMNTELEKYLIAHNEDALLKAITGGKS